jgi:drug/metabolite transporter (DMT)-like permease
MKESEVSQSTGSQEKHDAGAFDVRNIIAALIGLYGVVLVIVGLVDTSSAEMTKTGGVNANLWAGIVMVVVAAAFAAWSRIRPIVVTAPRKDED